MKSSYPFVCFRLCVRFLIFLFRCFFLFCNNNRRRNRSDYQAKKGVTLTRNVCNDHVSFHLYVGRVSDRGRFYIFYIWREIQSKFYFCSSFSLSRPFRSYSSSSFLSFSFCNRSLQLNHHTHTRYYCFAP